MLLLACPPSSILDFSILLLFRGPSFLTYWGEGKKTLGAVYVVGQRARKSNRGGDLFFHQVVVELHTWKKGRLSKEATSLVIYIHLLHICAARKKYRKEKRSISRHLMTVLLTFPNCSPSSAFSPFLRRRWRLRKIKVEGETTLFSLSLSLSLLLARVSRRASGGATCKERPCRSSTASKGSDCTNCTCTQPIALLLYYTRRRASSFVAGAQGKRERWET